MFDSTKQLIRQVIRIVGLLLFAYIYITGLAFDRALAEATVPGNVQPVEPPLQLDATQRFSGEIAEVDSFVRDQQARSQFDVDGKGLAVAVLDTGILPSHVDFKGRIPIQVNFTADNGGALNNALDANGHGTNVSGIIAANGVHFGMAPSASIIPVKVLDNRGGGSFDLINKGLQWVIDNQAKYNITVVKMSLGDGSDAQSDASTSSASVSQKISKLNGLGIAVVVAAGNDYFKFKKEGMAFPAIDHDAVSVGAVYDTKGGSISYQSGATANVTDIGMYCPFSQRLSAQVGGVCQTVIFAPGALVTSSGIINDTSESVDSGTSQATPVISGVILLMQEYHKRITGRLPAVSDIERWMQLGGVSKVDGVGENDNVPHAGQSFKRIDVVGAIDAMNHDLKVQMLVQRTSAMDLRIDPQFKSSMSDQAVDGAR